MCTDFGTNSGSVVRSNYAAKIDFSQLPYILENKKKKGKQKEDAGKENADIFPTQEDVNPENDDISGPN